MKKIFASATLTIALSVACFANGGIILSDFGDKDLNPCSTSKKLEGDKTDEFTGIITSFTGIITSFTGIITSATGIITSSSPSTDCGIITS